MFNPGPFVVFASLEALLIWRPHWPYSGPMLLSPRADSEGKLLRHPHLHSQERAMTLGSKQFGKRFWHGNEQSGY